MSVEHATIDLEQRVDASVRAVWAAFSDPVVRARWSVPDGEEQVCLDDDFTPGGRGRYRCGSPGVLEFQGEIEYVQIEPERLVVHTDTVRTDDGLLATALLTWRFEDLGADVTRVEVVDQVVSFVGPGMIEGHRNGHRIALAQLAGLLRH
ncbi:SRPBCC domain-containing protein [Aeromicrobium sp. CTD01-1L150]|uniref:SRPBCC domain-containing protein n=1 Tax=Aeromicrobium sp. CTD01-1L150 TaxID=3341830 RepID=UPI0035C2510D